MSDYYFYLSYARADYDPYLAHFCENLAREIALRSGDRDDRIAFFNTTEIQLGADWPSQIAEALQTSRTLVPVYSPSYFQSEYCAKELQFFNSRLENFVKTSTGHLRPPAIKPVLWIPIDSASGYLPSIASEIQYVRSDAPEVYRSSGLRHMIKVRRYEDEYVDFVERLASEIIDAAKGYHLPRTSLSWDDVVSRENSFRNMSPSSDSSFGPATVQFIYVAARKDEILPVRGDVQGYGDGQLTDWQPFLPESSVVPALIAQREAANERLVCEVSVFDDALINRIGAAESSNTPVVLLVDAWTLLLQKYRSIISEFAKHAFNNCAIIIIGSPLGSSDQLASIIPELYGDKRPWKVYEVKSEKELERALQKALAAIRKRLVMRAAAASSSNDAAVTQPAIPLPAIK